MSQVEDKPHHRVVAALVERNGRYLIAQRRPQATLPLLWEFPGGRVEPGESDQQALKRELLGCMGVQVEVGDLVLHVTHGYSGYDLDLLVYQCELVGDEPRPIRVNDVRWVTPEQLSDFPFPGADQQTVDALLEDTH